MRGTYSEWLSEMIDAPWIHEPNVKRLLKQLYSIDFTFKVANDVNRVDDGMQLRKEFYGELDDILEEPISVLEVLIALARRISEYVLGDLSERHEGTSKWFWLMVSNLGLIRDGVVLLGKGDICIKIERWLSRDFSPMGVGSIFPLRKNRSGLDQRIIEIWQQFCLFLAENPELEG